MLYVYTFTDNEHRWNTAVRTHSQQEAEAIIHGYWYDVNQYNPCRYVLDRIIIEDTYEQLTF